MNKQANGIDKKFWASMIVGMASLIISTISVVQNNNPAIVLLIAGSSIFAGVAVWVIISVIERLFEKKPPRRRLGIFRHKSDGTIEEIPVKFNPPEGW